MEDVVISCGIGHGAFISYLHAPYGSFILDFTEPQQYMSAAEVVVIQSAGPQQKVTTCKQTTALTCRAKAAACFVVVLM